MRTCHAEPAFVADSRSEGAQAYPQVRRAPQDTCAAVNAVDFVRPASTAAGW